MDRTSAKGKLSLDFIVDGNRKTFYEVPFLKIARE